MDPVADDLRDERLATLLSELADQVARGQVVDFDNVCRAHPDLAKDLRYLWGTVLVTDAARTVVDEVPGASSSGSSVGGDVGRWRGLSLPTTIGDYRLEEELGRGGMGVVFLATQISLDRAVAVKMILRGRLASQGDLKRFLAEASATASLQHPNIVPVYDVGDIDGRPFFSMQLVLGETLADRLVDGPLPEAEAELGLDVRESQIAEMRAAVDDIDFAAAQRRRGSLGHDSSIRDHSHAISEVLGFLEVVRGEQDGRPVGP